MKNIELVKMAFENVGATCEINDDKLEVAVNLTAYNGYEYTFGTRLEIDEDIPAINFLSTWSRDGFAMDFSYYGALECQTESEEEFREVGAAFECWMERFFDEYIKLAEEYTIEAEYGIDWDEIPELKEKLGVK